jgi:hypothetical protein
MSLMGQKPALPRRCCARAATGQAATAPPISLMNCAVACPLRSSGDGILTPQTSALIGAEIGIKTIAAVYSGLRH